MRLLNHDLDKADVTRIEDPCEDFFLAPIATTFGEIPIFMGTFAHSAFYLDCLFEAFQRIADHRDRDLLASVEALLRISQETARRAGLERRVVGDGTPSATISLPPEVSLRCLADRVRWTRAALSAAGIDPAHLTPFILAKTDSEVALSAKHGNGPIDYRPFCEANDGFVLVSPSNISTAARAAIVDHILATDRERHLANALMAVQADRLSESRFVRTDYLTTMWRDDEASRMTLTEYSTGRFVHIQQIVGPFAGWRQYGFAEPAPPDPALASRLTTAMRDAQQAARAHDGYCFGATLYLMGGWGPGHLVDFEQPSDLREWGFLPIEVPDVIALATCENGTLGDLWRIDALSRSVDASGFTLRNMSGTLNLFQWWCDTDGALVPQNDRDMLPPMSIVLPTDGLFTTRQEAAEAHDRRATALPDGAHRAVVRLEAQPGFGTLDPIYVSYSALQKQELLGVTLAGRRPAWLHLRRPIEGHNLEHGYQSWIASLHWLSLVMPILDDAGTADNTAIMLSLDLVPVGNLADGDLPDAKALDTDITVEISARTRSADLKAGQLWQRGARLTDNRAEIALAAALLEAASGAAGNSICRAEALASVQAAIPSSDVRWRHAYVPDRAADILRLNNVLTQSFRGTPRSAASLVKYGHALSPTRKPGTIIEGKPACSALLAELHATSLERLLDGVAAYNRAALAELALGMLQSSLAQEQHWGNTARALRGIHGETVDLAVSLAHHHRVNGVIRASSLLAELAASHSPIEGGLEPGVMDFEELSALVLHHFGYCELVAIMAGDRLEPRLIVSPTGDLLYDHSFGEEALAPGATALHADMRARQVADYGQRSQRAPGPPSRLNTDLEIALKAEYGVDPDLLWSLVPALCSLAVEDSRDVLVLARSELLARLRSSGFAKDAALEMLIDRLTLPARSGWHDVERGAHHNDFDLGRFDRPRSLIGRPLLAISQDTDPFLTVGPAVVERALLHNISGALDGSLQDRFWMSRAMRSYVGRAANLAGMAFNDQVAADLCALGLNAQASVAPWACLNHQATPIVKLLGDIDVLAISDDGQHAWVIEAKDIKLCRTLGETARRLSDYRGLKRSNGKPDNLLRHLDRVAYVRAHASDLAKRLKLSVTPEVHGLVVVDMPQPMVFVKSCLSPDAVFVRRVDIAGIDWKKSPQLP